MCMWFSSGLAATKWQIRDCKPKQHIHCTGTLFRWKKNFHGEGWAGTDSNNAERWQERVKTQNRWQSFGKKPAIALSGDREIL